MLDATSWYSYSHGFQIEGNSRKPILLNDKPTAELEDVIPGDIVVVLATAKSLSW